jgi:hypothetical protein
MLIDAASALPLHDLNSAYAHIGAVCTPLYSFSPLPCSHILLLSTSFALLFCLLCSHIPLPPHPCIILSAHYVTNCPAFLSITLPLRHAHIGCHIHRQTLDLVLSAPLCSYAAASIPCIDPCLLCSHILLLHYSLALTLLPAMLTYTCCLHSLH